jgi:hypothetical protein
MPTPFQRRPGAQLRPSFSRDFAGLKTLDHGVGPAITFTRASNATFFDASGTLQTASNNTPRFDHDPATGASRGLLIEEARTNLLERSAEFDNASWTKENATVTADATTSPAGSTTADALIEDSGALSAFRVLRDVAVTAAAHTLSCFVKANGRDNVQLQFSSGGAFTATQSARYALSGAGTSTSVGGSPTHSIQSFGDGWYRCSLTATATSAANARCSIFILDSSNNVAYTGDGTSGLYLWGAQLEAGAFATSYIPTTSAAATRSADSAVVTPISSFYNQAEGTLFAEWASNVLPPSGAFPKVVEIGVVTGSQTDSSRIEVYSSSGNLGLGTYVVGGNVTSFSSFSSVAGVLTVGATNKASLVYKTDDFRAALNGALFGSADTSGSVPNAANATQLGIGRASNGTNSGHITYIRKIAYWPKRLTNTLLKQLTT